MSRADPFAAQDALLVIDRLLEITKFKLDTIAAPSLSIIQEAMETTVDGDSLVVTKLDRKQLLKLKESLQSQSAAAPSPSPATSGAGAQSSSEFNERLARRLRAREAMVDAKQREAAAAAAAAAAVTPAPPIAPAPIPAAPEPTPAAPAGGAAAAAAPSSSSGENSESKPAVALEEKKNPPVPTRLPSTSPSTSGADHPLLTELISMGFERDKCLEALLLTNYSNLQAAVQFLLDPIAARAAMERKQQMARMVGQAAEPAKPIAPDGPTFADVYQRLVKTGNFFVDPNFPAESKSIGLGIAAIWARPLEFCAKQPFLFVDGVEPGDVVQGQLGNCWFLGSLAIVASRVDLLSRLFVFSDSALGIYCVQFYKDGKWQKYLVDDLLPCNPQSAKLLFGRCMQQNEMWVPIVEKAFAKMHGSYANIVGGGVADGLRMLTGGHCSEIFIAERLEELLLTGMDGIPVVFNELAEHIASGAIIGASSRDLTPEEVAASGVAPMHAYSVLKVAQLGDARLLHVRNPWGHREWQGRWSDNSAEWKTVSEEEKKRIGYVNEDDGCFWIELGDFLRFFDRLYVLNLFPETWERNTFVGEWKGASAGGDASKPTYMKNPMVEFTNSGAQACRVHVALEQPRKIPVPGQRTPPPSAIAFDVATSSVPGFKPLQPISYRVRREPARQTVVSKELLVQPGQSFVVIPFTVGSIDQIPFTLQINSERPLTFNESLGDLESESPAPVTSPVMSRHAASAIFFGQHIQGERVEARPLPEATAPATATGVPSS